MNTTFKVDNRIVMEADNMSKELHLPFRDCLDILVNAYLNECSSLENLLSEVERPLVHV